ncbi:hypothetical protein GCK72_004462 [Caenorhabditis remanei]|uniref:Uncharacterized protein n=1 Tax=Caenorhabditis remanei TaxID=31234 RepID=A0A6A5HCE2_CAERE|nr:hypothetical protein GCK72_004462 [Caenorhabditis remanei]KAF1764514.1 hypothetical protein GCK72_004462 [Caenorhabditis remanei]
MSLFACWFDIISATFHELFRSSEVVPVEQGYEVLENPDPAAKYTMAQTKDGDLSRPSGLPSNGNPGSSAHVIPPASKSGPVAGSSSKTAGTPVPPQRNRRRKLFPLENAIIVTHHKVITKTRIDTSFIGFFHKKNPYHSLCRTKRLR